MSAELLREAASLMRERAKAAGSDWNADCEPGDSLHLWVTDYDPSDPSGQTPMQRLVGGADSPWSEHIASWHPTVALAVADWLEESADHLDWYEDDDLRLDLRATVCPTALEGPECSVLGQALAVARAYLGRDS